MKVEVKTVATKEEKIVTLSESEFDQIVADIAKLSAKEANEIEKSDPMLDLLLLMTRARVCAIIHEKLFNNKED